jgi:hypothetical protein
VRIRVNAVSRADCAQVEQLLRFYLNVLEEDVDSIEIALDAPRDALGVALQRCRLSLRLAAGDALDLEETQADLVLAVTRAMDRATRTVRRRTSRYRVSRMI